MRKGKITFKKVSGEIVTRTIKSINTIEKYKNDNPFNEEKGLYFFLDVEQGDKFKSCKIDNIIKIEL
jgi:hypothetical protein